MSEKNIYKDFNNINVDEHEFDDINVDMTDLQKSKLKSNLKSNIKTRKFVKSKIAAASVAAALILSIGIGYTNPSFAAQIPILNPIVEMLGHTGDYAKYSDIVNKTVTCNGKSFTINSIVCNDNSLIIGYTAESNNKIDSTGPLFSPNFKVNGKWLHVGYSGGVKNVNDKTIMGTLELMGSKDMVLPDKFKFEMSFDKFDGTAGNWYFKFNISKAELSKSTKIYKPNQVIICKDEKLTITKVSLTPLSTVISVHSNKKYYENKAVHEQPNIPYFIILDDKGNELSGGSVSGQPSSEGYNCTLSFAKTNENAKYISIINWIPHGGGYAYTDKDGKNITLENPDPYAAKDVLVPINTNLPIELSQGNIGKVTLTKISFSNNNDNVIIQGIINGKLPNYQTVDLQGDNPKAAIRLLNVTIIKIDTDKYEFTKEYSGLNTDKNFKLRASNLDFIQYNSRVTIPLK